GNPSRSYPKTAVGANFPGTFQDYVAGIVSQWQQSDSAKMASLGKALEDLGLTWKVEAKPVDDTQVELRVGRLVHSRRGGAHDLVNIADVGFGLSQSLPVVVALLAARPRQTVYLEQPEIHLHPKAQRQMAKLIAENVARGVVVIVETHSNLLLREFQTIVATQPQVLSPGKVKLHWFTRNANDGVTQLQSADLDEDGAFGKWPQDFDEVNLDSEKAYLDAVENRGGRQ
ncbi:MAG: AAA family ATPase, partial [Planctomycetota bacterium]|nr:AAA family ATPase [Planctomycetota bacterium]